MYRTILFDLDGTLTASGEGITKSVQYALRRLGREADDLKALEVFIGPPLLEQFVAYCGMSEEEALRGVRYYRERYNVTGLYENYPYKGIRELLGELKRRGCILGVSSSKPDEMVKKILSHFELTEYFDEITGSDAQRHKMTKAEVIEITLKKLGYEEKREQVVMIGDREQDVAGAHKAGVDCIGVVYGYGSRDELEKAGAEQVVETVDDLSELLSRLCP